MSNTTPQILDVTLRDGSYVIDFQFTADDTALLVSVLDSAGIPYIEVGHGLGLGAARAGHGDQAASDTEYLTAAADATSASRFGAFFIPGIGAEDDIRLAADLGAGFVRIGTNITELDAAEPFVTFARDAGLLVFSNLMKSYAVPADEFAARARQAAAMGIDIVYLVDSAGAMLPEDVRAYISEARSASSVRLGFHGHNNLALGLANTVEAFDAGAEFLDASLQGMGRSEGNASTEVLAAVLQKRGRVDNIDVNALLDASEAFVRPMLATKGVSGLGVTFGRAGFHSSFLGKVLTAAQESGVDARDLILSLCERDRINAADGVIQEAVAELLARPRKRPARVSLAAQSTADATAFLAALRQRVRELKERARKTHLPPVLNIVVSPHEPTHVSPYVETHFGCALTNVMLEDATLLAEVCREADGWADYLLVDEGAAGNAVQTGTSVVLYYSDAGMIVRAAAAHLAALIPGGLTGTHLAVTGHEALTALLCAQLRLESAEVRLVETAGLDQSDLDALKRARAYIGIAPRAAIAAETAIEALPGNALVFDAAIASFDAATLETAHRRNLKVVRIDYRPVLAATALERIHLHRLANESMGVAEWDGVRVVAGGVIGRPGDVVVDSISRPTRVLGVADGTGGLAQTWAERDAVEKVRLAIAQKQLRGFPAGDQS